MNKQHSVGGDEMIDALEDNVPRGRQKAVSAIQRAGHPSSFQNAELNFPGKLHVILDTPGYSDIICWLPHGRAWRVLQPQQFEEKVLPLFFRHGRYASFTRQVNGWGFRRIVSGPDYNSYFHKQFLRGKAELCQQMTRPSKEEKKLADLERPPDFYQMEPMGAKDTGRASSDQASTAHQPSSDSAAHQPQSESGVGGSSSQVNAEVHIASSLTLSELYLRLQRELDALEQRKRTILSQLVGSSPSLVQSGLSFPIIGAPLFLQQPRALLAIPFESQLESLRLQRAMLRSKLSMPTEDDQHLGVKD